MQNKAKDDHFATLQDKLVEMEQVNKDYKEQIVRLEETCNKNQDDFEKQVSLRMETEKKLGELFSY